MQQALFAAALAVAMISPSAHAVAFVPAGLAPGESYQLVFVTSGSTIATSSDISYYNSFVQTAAANAGLAGNWSAIVSTGTVDARTNAVVSTKVFNMNGEQVATSYADFWDGSHTTGVGIDYTEFGAGKNTNVWTGSDADGTSAGANVLGNSMAVWGESTLSSSAWISRGTQSTTVSYSLYALSETFTAPIPEPGAYAMLLAGLGLVGVVVRRKKRMEA